MLLISADVNITYSEMCGNKARQSVVLCPPSGEGDAWLLELVGTLLGQEQRSGHAGGVDWNFGFLTGCDGPGPDADFSLTPEDISGCPRALC